MMLDWPDILSTTLLMAWVLVATADLAIAWYGLPKGLACHCPSPEKSHSRSALLFVGWVLPAVDTFLLAATSAPSPGGSISALMALAVAGWWLVRWWIHSKNTRKKLKGRILAVVRETAAGLKIFPEPAGGRA